MTSKPVAQLLIDLGVDRSHSRPHVSNDNPFTRRPICRVAGRSCTCPPPQIRT